MRQFRQTSTESDGQGQDKDKFDNRVKNMNAIYKEDELLNSPTVKSNQQDDQIEIIETLPAQQENDYFSDSIICKNDNGQRKRFSLLTGIEEFGKYSLGLHIFFDQLKELIKIFFIIVLISIPSLYTNYTGRSIESISGANLLSFFLLKFTPLNLPIADIETYKANSTENEKLQMQQNNEGIIKDFLTSIASDRTWLVVPDICYCLVFIVLVLRMYKRQKKIGKKRNKRNLYLTTSDYTIEVAGFPANLKNPDEIKKFFSKFGEIKQCYLGRNYCGILSYYLEKYNLQEQIKQLKEYKSLNEQFSNKDIENQDIQNDKQQQDNHIQINTQQCDDNDIKNNSQIKNNIKQNDSYYSQKGKYRKDNDNNYFNENYGNFYKKQKSKQNDQQKDKPQQKTYQYNHNLRQKNSRQQSQNESYKNINNNSQKNNVSKTNIQKNKNTEQKEKQNNNDELNISQKQDNNESQIPQQENKKENIKTINNEYDTQLQKLEIELKKLELKISHIRNTKIGYEYYHDDYPSVNAFITYEKISDRSKCLKAFQNARDQVIMSCFRQKFPEEMKFRGIYQLKINQYVSEPSNIMWENLGFKQIRKQFRLIFVVLMCFLIIFALICVSFVINYKAFSLINKPNCIRDRYYTFQEAATSSKYQECFCHQYEFDSIYENIQIQKMCGKYITTFSNMNYKSIIISLQTIIINVIIEFFIVKMRWFFKFTSHTEQSNTLAILIFVTTSLNIFMQLHLTAYGFSIWHSVGKILSIYNDDVNGSNLLRSIQNIVDYNRAWQFNIGLNVQYAFFINIMLPHTTDLLLSILIKFIKNQRKKSNTKLFPKKSKDLFSADFTIYKFQAIILNSIFFAFIYSSNAPLLLLFSLLSLIIQYWVYKFTIIRVSKKPPQFDYRLGNLVLKIIPFAIILHLLVSILLYTNHNIFPNQDRKARYDLEKTYEYDQDDGNRKQIYLNVDVIMDRISEMKFYIVLISLMLIALIFQKCVKSFLNKIKVCLSRKKVFTEQSSNSEENQYEQTFEQFKQKLSDHTLVTYDITKNPKYSKVIELLDNKKIYTKESIQVQLSSTNKGDTAQNSNSPNTKSKILINYKEKVKDPKFEQESKESDFIEFKVIQNHSSQYSEKRQGTPIPQVKPKQQKKDKNKKFNEDKVKDKNTLQVVQNKVINIPTDTQNSEDQESEENNKQIEEYDNEFM